MKLLITGCAGFIGANFTKYWLDKYPTDTVVGVDLLTYAANIDALEMLKKEKRFSFYRADIADGAEMDRIFALERPSVVVNFAAESHVDRSIECSAPFLRTNVLGTGVLLDCAVKYSARFHQISTDEVYGDLPLDSCESFTEESSLSPSSPYSASKAAADMLALSYLRTHGLFVTISRSSNNYGIYQHCEKLIPKTAHAALSDSPIGLYGDGKNVRNWLHVSDHCTAVDLILKSGQPGKIYNVSGGTELSNLALVKRILSILNKPEELITFVGDRPGHDRKYSVSSDKLSRELGWRENRNFDFELSKAVAWYGASF